MDLVLIKEGALDYNVPDRDTLVGKNHGIFINKKLIAAGKLINGYSIRRVFIGKHNIYNVFMGKHSEMIVNNMLVETMHPRNNYFKNKRIAKKKRVLEEIKLINKIKNIN